MNTRYHKYYFIIGFSILTLTACVSRKYERPAVNSNDLYRDNTTGDSTTIASLPWKNLFADAALQALIQQGINENLDLKQAIERIKIAEATLLQSKGALLPSLTADLSVTDAKQSRAALNFPPGININTETQTYKAQLSTSWEADIWGKLSSAKRSAYASLLQSDAAKRAVQTQLIANIANGYYNLLALDKQLAITEQTIRIRQTDVETMKSLKEGAVVNGAAVVQSEANLYAAQVTLPDLKRNIRETENALSILLGKGPGKIERGTIDQQTVYSNLQTGVSAQLLQNRPDVQAAEFAFRAAFENKNVARSYFYPALTLTANGGLSSLSFKNFFDNSVFYNLIGGITQPIFNKGQNKARLKTAEAQKQIAFYSFQQTLLTSGQEVSNALYAYQTAAEKETTRAMQVASLTKAVDYTKELLRYSSATNYTDVLTSEQSLLAAQLSGINDRLQKLQSVVNLYRALGGGWKE
ncbi:efflux transporter outer membrane subunit [Pedobacter heparinus]|uniref:RND efflux system, outer membrane lipoprotein, NodT family n=1 Tax=Pedobacter heparinus (strain ATCC 13125 / DSM 2366 / CIP 104194 / JCM 7457 / NBRC 12017 / NCIMB 9290 / NRRL B-14731 / HIM 762-3) TaxID=485917 RepID=C6XS59_PEDHD|nr:efflux transporter outer membrane subunit [Pedobacter heparinus]ACU03404.1 RND efflux system, outer membrane lipoprotein, NodT family [Pedobacter heparinus DSM 2366]